MNFVRNRLETIKKTSLMKEGKGGADRVKKKAKTRKKESRGLRVKIPRALTS